MKTFKNFGSLFLGVSALFLVTSCSKNMDDQMAKGDREVGSFSSAPCGPFIGLIGANGGGYFWVGSPADVPNRQLFSTTNFSDDRYFKVTGVGGMAFYTGGPVRQIGVGEAWIRPGKAIWLELGSSFTTQRMQGFDLGLHAELVGGVGSIELYDDATMVKSIPFSLTQNTLVSYVAGHHDPKFNRVKVSCTSGKVALSGRFPSALGIGQTKFYLVPEENTFVFLQIKATQTTIGMTAFDDWYFNYKELGVNRPDAMRQNRVMGTSLAVGSGEFPAMNPGKEWLKLDGGQGNTLVARYDNQRLGVNDQWIDGMDVLTITPGADFPTSSFRSFEVREAVLDGGKMEVKLWKGNMQVGGGMTTGVDATFNPFVATEDFDRITISNVSGDRKSVV